MSADNIVLNSCHYTPVYFIENPGVSQARSSSFIVQPNNQNGKPVSESLKRFYENSGKLESNLNTVDCGIKSKLSKKTDHNVVGNNLKLASFLLPKSETKNEVSKPILTPVNSVVLKPVYIANNFSVNNVSSTNQVPKLDVDSRLVKLSEFSNIVRSQNGKILPKIKPKENSPSTTTTKPKHTLLQALQPVQLVKLGETYHSVNQLSGKQMKLVNHALKMLNNTQTPPSEPAFNPTTNTKFLYKVVSQKDFAEKNKVTKPIVAEIKMEPGIKIEKPEMEPEFIEENEPNITVETKMTRSGRIVKLPKSMIIDDSPSKPKKKTTAIAKCLQCNTKFISPFRLQRHYETYPAHLPVKAHTSLFHCLISIVSAGPESTRASILVQQLEELIDKLRSCVPCLLACDNGKENVTSIGDEISKLFGISPGKYNLNTEALGCKKDSDGYCSHNPRPQIAVTDKTQVIPEKIENGIAKSPSNVLKVNLQERRPTILRKMECRKQKLEKSSHNDNRKKMKLLQDTFVDKNSIEIGDLVALLSDKTKTENNESKNKDNIVLNDMKERQQETVPEKKEKATRPQHIQFHSTHFDIRSSPIKPTSTVFRKFQINPEKMTKYIEIIQPIQLNQLANAEITENVDKISNINEQNILSNTNIITSKESENLNYTTKNWCDDSSFMKCNDLMNDRDHFMKPDDVIEPALLHIKDVLKASNEVTKEPVFLNIDNNLKATNNANKEDDFMKSNIFTKESNLIEHELVANKESDFIKPNNIFVKSHTFAQDNSDVIDKVTDQSNDFMETDMLIDESFLNTQQCKVIDDITNRNDYMKANILTEPTLIHNEGTKDFSDPADSFMSSNVYTDTTMHSNNETRVMDVSQNNEIDIDLSSNQGQSIMSFLESLGNELAYSETDSRNNHTDFQLDLFSFNS